MTIYNQEVDWKIALPKDENLKLFLKERWVFVQYFPNFSKNKRIFLYPFPQLDVQKGRTLVRQNAVNIQLYLENMTKKKLFSKIASIKFKIQQSFVHDK